MAPLANHFSFFLLIVFVSSLHIEARVGKFLIENTYNYAPISETPTLAPSISPAPAPIGGEISYAPTPSEGEAGYAPTPIEVGTGYAPAPAPVESDNPYGLYGGDSTEILPEKTITATAIGNDEDEIPVDEIANERLGEYNAGNQYSYNNNNNNNGYSNNYNSNGYSSNNYNNNGYSNSAYNYNKGYTTNNYNNNGYENEQKGMSDTRFLENGKYYYNLNNENYEQNGYESVKGNSNSEGYYGYGEKSKYEFDTMEEYEKQQGYPDTEKNVYEP